MIDKEMDMALIKPAYAHFDEARRLAPGYERAWINAARALDRMDRFDDALATLQALTRIMPESYDGWAELGAAYEARGHLAEAHAAYRRAVRPQAAARRLAALRRRRR